MSKLNSVNRILIIGQAKACPFLLIKSLHFPSPYLDVARLNMVIFTIDFCNGMWYNGVSSNEGDLHMKITEVVGATMLGVAIALAVWNAAAIESEAISLWQGAVSTALAGAFAWVGYKITRSASAFRVNI